MELYIEPAWAKKDTKFKKGHATWNKGRKEWTTTDPAKRRKMRRDLAKGRKHVWDKRAHIAYNGIPTSVYNLAGEYLGTFLSALSRRKSSGRQRGTFATVSAANGNAAASICSAKRK